MTRRSFLAAGAAAMAAPANPPNVVLIVADDLGSADLGCLGAKDLATPHIDSLARAGTVFRNWYSNAPVCAPARASILSGRYPARAGVPTNGGELTPGIPTVATVLRSRGYATAAIGKWHLGSSDQTCPNAHGFDSFYGFLEGCVDYYSHRYYWGEPRRVNHHDLWRNRTEIFEDGQYLTERIAAEATGHIRNHASRPVFLYTAFSAPHYPMHAPEKYMRRFPNLAPERRTYAAMLAAMDDGVGEIVRALEQTGKLDNTLIAFVGDNGATTEKRAGLRQEYATAGSNGRFRGWKFSLFDGGMHVPAIVRWPAAMSARPNPDAVVMSMDLLPTIAAVCGAPEPAGIDGKNIFGSSRHDAIFWAQGPQLAVRRGKWKLVLNAAEHGRSPESAKPLTGDDAVWLSDLEADPGETRNLRRLHPNLVDELTTAAAKWRESQTVTSNSTAATEAGPKR